MAHDGVIDSAKHTAAPASTRLGDDAMDPSNADLMSLAARVERLEMQNRLFKRAGIALLLLPLSLVITAQARPPHIVEAEEFVLRDSNGTKRAALQLTQTAAYVISEAVPPVKIPAGISPNLTLYGENGEARVVLSVTSLASSLQFYGSHGNPHITIGNLGEDTPTMTLSSGDNKADIIVSHDGPSFDLEDANGFSANLGRTALVTSRTGEQHQTSAASLVLLGKDGKLVWSAP